MKEEVRPIYFELQGFLSEISPEDGYLYRTKLHYDLSAIIDKLNAITNKDYSEYKIDTGQTDIRKVEIRTKISRLISVLRAEYFNDETQAANNPSESSSGTVINLSQSQQQTAQAQIVMLLDFQELINDKLKTAEMDEERSFLEDVRSKLASVKNVGELMQLLVLTANTYKLTIEQLIKLFS